MPSCQEAVPNWKATTLRCLLQAWAEERLAGEPPAWSCEPGHSEGRALLVAQRNKNISFFFFPLVSVKMDYRVQWGPGWLHLAASLPAFHEWVPQLGGLGLAGLHAHTVRRGGGRLPRWLWLLTAPLELLEPRSVFTQIFSSLLSVFQRSWKTASASPSTYESV